MPDHGRTHRVENPRSIPVAELLARPGPQPVAGVQPPGPVFVGNLLHREGYRDTEKRSRQAPRIVGAVAAVAVLCGALMATTQTLRSARESEPVAGSVAPQHITGSKVFRPDLIRASVNGGAARPAPAGQQPNANDQAQPAPDGPANPDSPGNPDSPAEPGAPGDDPGAVTPTTTPPAPPEVPVSTTKPAPPSTTSSTGGVLCGTLRVLDPVVCPLLTPVQAFYAAAPTEPAQAYSLLDSGLQGDDIDAFAQSWQGIKSATVDSAAPAGRNALKVVVTYLRTDGYKLVTVQRLEVRYGLGVQPKIVQADLLLASRG